MKPLALFAAALTLLVATGSASALTNRLKDNPSPYLALHADDLVAWQEWNPQTLALAKKQNKLIFLSLGYFSCQVCHKMQREALRDPVFARFLNAYFIPVLVDREIMTALDYELQAYAMQTQGLSGWPLNIVLTPEGHPLTAVFYQSPKQLLQSVSYQQLRWEREGKTILADARAATDVRLAYTPKPVRVTPVVARKYRDQFLLEVFEHADTYRGGFGSDSKYPMAPQLDTLLELQRREPDPRLEKYLRIWLDWMADQGLYDHVGGGFFRYSSDAEWRSPHCEKMLGDNALLAMIYLKAADIFNQPRYRRIAFGTLDFIVAGMQDSKTGGFMASTSALDEQHRPGAYYQWNKDELKRLLDAAEYSAVARVWGIEQRAPLAYGYLPMNRLAPDAGEAAKLESAYRKLAEARKQRTLVRDVKLLASLNGLALQAFSQAARIEPRYAATARKLRDFAVGTLWQNGELAKAMSKGRLIARGELEDYAFLASGLVAYAELDNGKQDLLVARELMAAAWRDFRTANGWKAQKRSLLAGSPYLALVDDGPTPSPSAMLIGASLRAGDAALATQGQKALERGHEILDSGVFWHATQVKLMQPAK